MTEQQARDFATSLGAEIASWRRRRGLNRKQLAEMVDLSETTIGRIERGGVDAAAATPDVWRIAVALGLSFSDLVRRAEVALDLSAVTSARTSEDLPTFDASPSAPSSRLLALIDEYQSANPHASDQWISNQVAPAGRLDIKAWRKHGLRKLPSKAAMLALAKVLGKHKDVVLYEAGVDIGQIIEVEEDAGDEGPDSLPTTG